MAWTQCGISLQMGSDQRRIFWFLFGFRLLGNVLSAIWRHRNRWTLTQIMTCSLTASTHYLNQCWLIISQVPWHSSDGIIVARSNQQSKIGTCFLKSQGANLLRCHEWASNEGGHDDVIKWKHFLRYWPFVRGIHRLPVNYPHKGQWRETLMFSLICAETTVE